MRYKKEQSRIGHVTVLNVDKSTGWYGDGVRCRTLRGLKKALV